MAAIYTPACQGTERGHQATGTARLPGEEGPKLEACNEGKGAEQHSSIDRGVMLAGQLTTPHAVIVQADGHEVTVWQLEAADHPKCANTPRYDGSIQTTGVDLTEGANTRVCT